MSLQPTSAPGRDAQAAPAPAPAATSQAATTSTPSVEGPPPGAQPGVGGSMMMFLPIVILFAFLFFTTRGEKKKRVELESKLKKGDRVVTQSGIIGKLIEVSDRTVRAEIAPGVNVTMLKSAVQGIEDSESIKTEKKGASASKSGKKK